jgi:hypothetical protein
MSFLQGLTAGQNVAQGWLDTYEKSRKRKEETDLKAQREGILKAQPEYSQGYTAEQGQQLEAMASAINPETGRPYYNVQAGEGGNYTVTPDFTEGQIPRTGLGTGVVGLDRTQLQPAAFNQQRVANFLGNRVEGDITPERMETMRSRALANTLVDPMERQRSLVQLDANERAARSAAQAEELTGLQISNAKTAALRESETATREAANRAAVLKVGELLQGGGNLDIPSLYKVAGEAGADPAVLVKTAADFLNITEKSAKVTTEKLLREIDAASVDPTKFNTLLKKSFDPDPNDNLSPELRPAAGGGFQVFYGDKPMTQVFKDTKDMPALSQLASFYRDRLSGNPLATAVQIEALNASRSKVRADESTIGLNNARASQIKQMNDALATNLKNSEEAKAIQAQFAGLDDTNDPGGSKRQSLITQFNMLSVKAGGTIPVGGGGKKGSVLQTPVDVKKNDDGTYTAFAKDGGQALYNTFNGETIPLGMEVDTYKGMKEAAKKNGVGLVAGEDNGRLVIKFTGADGKFYDDAEKAKYAKPAAKPASEKPAGLSTTPTATTAAAPTPPTAKPVRTQGESFTEFRDRTIAWDKNRIAYEQMLTEQQLRDRLSKNAVGLQRPLAPLSQ